MTRFLTNFLGSFIPCGCACELHNNNNNNNNKKRKKAPGKSSLPKMFLGKYPYYYGSFTRERYLLDYLESVVGWDTTLIKTNPTKE